LGDLKHAEATLRNLDKNLLIKEHNNIQHNDPSNKENHIQDTKSISNKNHINNNTTNITSSNKSENHSSLHTSSRNNIVEIRKSIKSLATNSKSLQNLTDGINHLNEMHDENTRNEAAVSQHRILDSFSGRWNDSRFTTDIFHKLISQTNSILKENNVKQQVGIKQLDNSSSYEDQCPSINQWWNGLDLETITHLPDSELTHLSLHDSIHQAIKNVRQLRKKAFHALIHNKDYLLMHDARMNNTRNISQRLNPKIMDEPEAHHVILNHEKRT